MTSPTPFKISVSDEKLADIRKRVEAFRWFPAPAGFPDWSLGVSTPVLKDLQNYWLTEFDWREAEARLNQYPHYTAEIDGQIIHFVHIVGEAKGTRPHLLTHGWPGTVFEFWDAIAPLAYAAFFVPTTSKLPSVGVRWAAASSCAFAAALGRPKLLLDFSRI